MKIRPAQPSELEWINEQYASIHFALSTDSDFIVIAEIDGIKAGVGRLTRVDTGTAELGGIYVLPAFRGNAIAAEIVNFLLKNSEFPTLFCIPFAHLSKFYQRFGFLPIDQSVPIPKKIGNKVRWCGNRYEAQVVLLYKFNAISAF